MNLSAAPMLKTVTYQWIFICCIWCLPFYSCTSRVQQIVPRKGEVSRLNTVAVTVHVAEAVVSMSSPDTARTGGTLFSCLFWPFSACCAWPSMVGLQETFDLTNSSAVRNVVDRKELEDGIGHVFVETIQENGAFGNIEYLSGVRPGDDIPQSCSNYNGTIHIDVYEFILRRTEGKKYTLNIASRVIMTQCDNKEILWRQERRMVANERLDLESCTTKDGKLMQLAGVTVDELARRYAREYVFLRR